jgi:hypothetical protein
MCALLPASEVERHQFRVCQLRRACLENKREIAAGKSALTDLEGAREAI